MRIVDIHTHLFSRPFFDALAAGAPGDGEPDERMRRVAEEAEIELPDPDLEVHVGRWLSEMDEKGVDHLGVFASLPEETGAVAAALRHAGGRLSGFALANPVAPAFSPAGAGDLMDEDGYAGFLVFPAMHLSWGVGFLSRALRPGAWR